MRVEVRRRAEAIVLPVLGVAVVLVAFEVAPRVGILPRATFPPLSESARALWDLITTGDLWPPVLDTLDSWVRAMVIATLIGVPLGLTIGASRLGRLLTGLTIDFLRPIPSVALIPILVLVYGTSPTLKVTLAVFGATFPLVFWNRTRLTVLLVTHDIDEAVYLADRILVLSAAPTRVRKTITVDLPRPRDQIATKELPEFAHLRASVFALIKAESGSGPPSDAPTPDG